MKKILALFLLLSSPALADTVTVEQLCQQLENYQPSDDVNYQPGKDVDGNDVVPADLAGSSGTIEMPEETTIAITLFQAQQFNLPIPGTGANYTPEMYVGNVTVKKDGSVYFNDKRLSQPQTQFLCDPSNSARTPLPQPPVSR